MKYESRKSRIIITICVTTIGICIGGLATWFQISAQEAVVNASRSELEQVGIQMEILLEETIEEHVEDMTLLAEHIAEAGVKEEDVVEHLSSQSQINEFHNLFYVNSEGSGVSIEGKTQDFSQTESFLQAVKNKVFITEPYVSGETGDVLFSVSVPVVDQGEVTAVLVEETSIREFVELAERYVGGNGDVFIIDHDLNFLFSSKENHKEGETIPQDDVEYMGSENVENALADIVNGQIGSFDYKYEGMSKIMVYIPIENTQWALAINAETEVINTELVNAVGYLQFICSAIFWALVILIFYIAITQRRSYNLLEKKAYYDSLTGLPNMIKLKRDMKRILKANRDKQYAVLIYDIEKFKVLNEMYGYEMGDRVLKTTKEFRETLGGEILVFARIGDDKFGVFAEREFLGDVIGLTDKCRGYYEEIIPELIGHDIQFKCGRYYIEHGEYDADDIMNKTSIAHKNAKETKGRILCDYDVVVKTKMLRDADITNKMKDALKNKEYKVYLQPKFSVHGNELIGAESLVRWIEADGNIIFPDMFIPLFEQNGFIVELDKYILESTCAALKEWMDRGVGLLPVSVNCSRLNINTPSFIEDTVAIVDKYGIPHHLIEIEITESTSSENEEVLKALFSKLRDLGFKISIDDFGSGFSSLSMLKNLQVDTLKMDRSFFVDENEEGRSELLIDGVVKLAHNLDMYVVAEGIETIDQIEMLKAMKCDAVQGYFYSRPIPIGEFEEKYGGIMPTSLDG